MRKRTKTPQLEQLGRRYSEHVRGSAASKLHNLPGISIIN